MKNSVKNDANKWYDFAADDIDSAKIMLGAKKYNMVCFFSHQAVEKALKAFLVSKGHNPPRVHNLIDLINLCSKFDKSFRQMLPKARILNQFYIPTRYPFASPSPTIEDPGVDAAEKALLFAQDIFNFCKNLQSNNTQD